MAYAPGQRVGRLEVLLVRPCSFDTDLYAGYFDAAQRSDRPDLRAQLDDWLSRHAAKLKDPKARVPLYVVNAEGGGIRAAYWTVTVLGEIQNQHPAFAEHLFSLSGVSGGSLGSAVFVALLAQQREDKMLDVKKTAQAILSEDFLSPVVASMLYPDLVQRFLPIPIARFDRAATLEQSWERAWRMHVPARARMSEPFDRLWENLQKPFRAQREQSASSRAI